MRLSLRKVADWISGRMGREMDEPETQRPMTGGKIRGYVVILKKKAEGGFPYAITDRSKTFFTRNLAEAYAERMRAQGFDTADIKAVEVHL